MLNDEKKLNTCFHCGSEGGEKFLIRNGYQNNKQQYICSSCQKTRKVRSLKRLVSNEFSLCKLD